MVNRKKYLKEMGIDIWVDKNKPAPTNTNLEAPRKIASSVVAADSSRRNNLTQAKACGYHTGSSQISDNFEELKKQVNNCTLCDLNKTRTHTVFGVGNEHAEIMFIGEAPGANEDLQGEPFVGRAGMLLNEMLKSIGLKRTDVYIANILKCRPPNNRDPSPQEVKLCTPYLQKQIALIKPKLLVAVGRIAAQFLLNTMESMARLRGSTYHYGENKIPLIVTYHPAYLLRSPTEKRKAYSDFLLIKKMSKT